jgi:hypothetical protein
MGWKVAAEPVHQRPDTGQLVAHRWADKGQWRFLCPIWQDLYQSAGLDIRITVDIPDPGDAVAFNGGAAHDPAACNAQAAAGLNGLLLSVS